MAGTRTLLPLNTHDARPRHCARRVNKKRFWPTVQAIKERYYLKYRGGAGSSADSEE